MTDSTRRFSNRADDYSKYRPGYPADVLDLLKDECNLTPASAIADVGSGTGILTELFLKNGNQVLGVEPNREMREAGERFLKGYANFTSITGTAEATTLEGGSVDFVTAGQALHWFDPAETRAEFSRILRLGGWVVFVWNRRKRDTTPFFKAYEDLLKTHGTDYGKVGNYDDTNTIVARFFGAHKFERRTFANHQAFDLNGLKGRISSSSYVPAPGEYGHNAMMREAERIFYEYETDGEVTIEYSTKVYYGRLR